MRKKASATADSTPTDNKDVAAVVVEVDDKILEKKPAVEDKKQSFVDQVAEGLAAKIPADRFTNDEEANGLPVVEEEGKDKPAEVPTEDKDTKVDAKEESEDAENAACEYIKGDDEAPRVTIPEEVKAVTEQEAELIEAADVAAGSPSKLGAMAAAVGAKLVKEIEAEAEAENEAEEEKKESSPEKPVEADEPETAAAEEEAPKLGAMAAAVGAKLAEKVEAEAEADPEVVIPDAAATDEPVADGEDK